MTPRYPPTQDPFTLMLLRIAGVVSQLSQKLGKRFVPDVLDWASGEKGFQGVFTKEYMANRSRCEVVMKELDLLEVLIPKLPAHDLGTMVKDGGGFSATRIRDQINHFQREYKLSLLYTRLTLVQTTASSAPVDLPATLQGLFAYRGEEVTRHDTMMKRALAVVNNFTVKFAAGANECVQVSQWAEGENGIGERFNQRVLADLNRFELVMIELELLNSVIQKSGLTTLALLPMLTGGGGFSAAHIQAQIDFFQSRNELLRLHSRLQGVQQLASRGSTRILGELEALFDYRAQEVHRHREMETLALKVLGEFRGKFGKGFDSQIHQWASSSDGFKGLPGRLFEDSDCSDAITMELELIRDLISKTNLTVKELLPMLGPGGGLSAPRVKAQIVYFRSKNELSRLRSRLTGVQKHASSGSPRIAAELQDLFDFGIEEATRHSHQLRTASNSLAKYRAVARRGVY